MRPLCYLTLLLLLALPGSPYVPAYLTGEVRDATGPVTGAEVRFPGHTLAATTDAVGRFQLPLPTVRPTRVVAHKPGHYLSAADTNAVPLVLRLTPLPAEDSETYAWVEPAADASKPHNCANCHADIVREWSVSGHARSATNRRFLNLYEGTDWQGRPNVGWSLAAEHKDGLGVCTSCHAPTVGFDDPAYFDLRQVKGVPAHGVHCDYCHKITGASTERVGLTHGRFGLQLLRPAAGQLFFGPLADADRGDVAFSALYKDSRYCASCHEGTVFGVHVYSTYSEWLASPARQQGQQCQSCHMAPTGTFTNLAPGQGGLPRDPLTLSNHRFFAGSQADMLRRCLNVAVTLTPGADGLRAEVAVKADQVGHRVPTGFIDRHLVLVVEGLTADSQPVRLRTGPTLPAVAGKEVAGLPGRLYAKLLRDFAGQSPVPFWRADPAAVDTRLQPGVTDRNMFMFGAGVQQVRVRLLYRRFWPETVRVKGWPDRAVVVVEQTLAVEAGRAVRWSSGK